MYRYSGTDRYRDSFGKRYLTVLLGTGSFLSTVSFIQIKQIVTH